MNHVPDSVVTAIDTFGEQLLLGDASAVSGTLRNDLQIEISPPDGSTAVCRYKTVHTQSPPTLRDRGSFVTTIVDAVDSRLQQWGIDPPPAYRYVDTVNDTHQYEGTLQLP